MHTDHPRLRGENKLCPVKVILRKGSPPLARGKLPDLPLSYRLYRITPACAGKTLATAQITTQTADHPRLRGENPCTKMIHRH